MVLRGEVGKRTVNARVDDGHSHAGASDTELPEREHAERLVISRLKLRRRRRPVRRPCGTAGSPWRRSVLSDTACTSGLAASDRACAAASWSASPWMIGRLPITRPCTAAASLSALAGVTGALNWTMACTTAPGWWAASVGDPGIEHRRGAGGGAPSRRRSRGREPAAVRSTRRARWRRRARRRLRRRARTSTASAQRCGQNVSSQGNLRVAKPLTSDSTGGWAISHPCETPGFAPPPRDGFALSSLISNRTGGWAISLACETPGFAPPPRDGFAPAVLRGNFIGPNVPPPERFGRMYDNPQALVARRAP